MLSSSQARKILQPYGITAEPVVTLVKRSNDVYRIECGGDVFFLKTYTKDWYGGDVSGTAFCVDHEEAAWAVLREHGLNAPEVIAADQSVDNPLGRPFIITRALTGMPFTKLLKQSDVESFRQILTSVGRYKRAMHSITFAYPGYITSAGLHAPPDPNAWQHSIWTAARFKQDMQAVWEADRASLPNALHSRMSRFFADHEAALDAAFQPPRFTHGDCHAHQFFLSASGQVSGVVDMEVASAGCPTADLFKFCIEMAVLFPVETRWWESFFEGYGEPAFNVLRLWMLAAHHINFQVVGWPGTRAQIVQHILDARDWRTLFHLI